MSNNRERIIFLIFSFSFIIAFIYITLTFSKSYSKTVDFKAFMTGAHVLLTEPAQLYDVQTQEQTQLTIANKEVRFLPFKNPPIIALLYLPLLFLNYSHAYVLSVFIIFLAILASNLYFSRLIKVYNLPLLLLLTAFFLPNMIGVFNGQPIFFLYLIFVLIYYFYNNKQEFRTGLACGLLFLKPQYLVVAPLLILTQKNKLKFAQGFFSSVTALTVLSVFLSRNFLSTYPQFLLLSESSLYEIHEIINMTSLSAFLLRFLNEQYAYAASLLVYFLFILMFYKKHILLNSDMIFVIIICAGLVFGIHVIKHDLVILQIPLIMLIKQKRKIFNYLLIVSLILPYILFSTSLESLVSVILLFVVVSILSFNTKLLNHI